MNWFRKRRYRRQHRRNIIRPSPVDKRDFKYVRTRGVNTPLEENHSLPSSVSTTTDIDLRPVLSAVRNQGSINCCFSFAGAGMIEALLKKKTSVKYTVSPSYNYYTTRIYDDTYPDNVGAYIKSYMKALYAYGFVWECNMPFKQKSSYKPRKGVNNVAQFAKDFFLNQTTYQTVAPSLYLNCLKKGQPIILGMIINAIWYKVPKDGIIYDTTQNQGGHAVLLVGRKTINGKKYGIIRNSWGNNFGFNGYCYVHWNHIIANSFDAWCINYK